jgi:3',5'-cyclic AMP phosphodiesterase CpdA
MTNKTGDPDEIKEFLRISAKMGPSIPVYYVAGNHDLSRKPTSESIAAYRKNYGRDFYSFRAGPIYGIVLDSALIIDPQMAEAEYQEQMSWLKKELETAKGSGAAQIIVFEHHPVFLDNVNEQDQYGNFPMERRKPILELMHNAGVHYVFAGHLHKNVTVRDGDIEITAVGPVGMAFDGEGSGIRLVNITAKGLRHQYFGFGKMPDNLEIK